MTRPWAGYRVLPPSPNLRPISAKRVKMKALVTGGSGYIGSAVVRQLLEDKQEVKVLIRESDRTEAEEVLRKFRETQPEAESNSEP